MEETLKYIDESVSGYVDNIFTSCLDRIQHQDTHTKLSIKNFLDHILAVEERTEEEKVDATEVEWKGYDSIDIHVEAIVTQENININKKEEEVQNDIADNRIKDLSPVISRKHSAKSHISAKISVKEEIESKRNIIKEINNIYELNTQHNEDLEKVKNL